MSSFGENLKSLRKEKGIGQIELSKALQVSKGIISLWENGQREPSMSSIIKLAKFFDVSADYLIGLSDY
ncbi:MAG: helix-turn-helix domain-containing protein [Christensenellales bacterium]